EAAVPRKRAHGASPPAGHDMPPAKTTPVAAATATATLAAAMTTTVLGFAGISSSAFGARRMTPPAHSPTRLLPGDCSNATMRLQSFFMLITVQPFLFASS